MIGSMTAGVQAMSSFVKGIEVIGNNISNINTIGFKGATTRFEDAFSNTLQRGTGNTGLGSNSVTQQIGTGTKIATIKTQFAQGSLQTTGGLSDLGISGEGFFRVRDTLQGLEYVTRAGDFRVDDQGFLVTNTGFRVQGLGLAADDTSANFSGRLGDPRSFRAARHPYRLSFGNSGGWAAIGDLPDRPGRQCEYFPQQWAVHGPRQGPVAAVSGYGGPREGR